MPDNTSTVVATVNSTPSTQKQNVVLNLEQFSPEELEKHVKDSVEQIHFDAEGIFHHLDPVFLELLKPLTVYAQDFAGMKANGFLAAGSLGMITAAAGFVFNPIFFAPGGLVAAAVASVPYIISMKTQKALSRKEAYQAYGPVNYIYGKTHPLVRQWLKECYNIDVSEDELNTVAWYITGNHNGERFTASSGAQYKLSSSGNQWWLSLWTDEQDLRVAVVGKSNTLKKAGRISQARAITATVPETEAGKLFYQKVELLERHTLSVEAQYRLDAAKKEAERIQRATAVLADLGAKKYQDKTEDTFALLNQELDLIIEERIEQEYSELTISEQFVAERYKKPLQVTQKQQLTLN